MEDLKAYIESGILELYVLGDVSPEERLQVETMASKHPEIKAELDAIEKSMELYASENAVEPPAHLRDRTLNSMVISFGDDRKFPSKTHFEDKTEDDAEDEVDGTGEHSNVVELRPAAGFNFYKYAFAACFALWIVSLAALFNIYDRLQKSNNLVASLQTQNQRFTNEVSLKDHQLQIFRDPSFKLLKLQGTPHSPSSALMVAWSPIKKKVMIDMGTARMPVNDKDHQYQLWALVGGKPVDLGVFDANPDSTDMKEMKSIASADAFAVTLEPRGGSASPTMDQMMVIGKF